MKNFISLFLSSAKNINYSFSSCVPEQANFDAQISNQIKKLLYSHNINAFRIKSCNDFTNQILISEIEIYLKAIVYSLHDIDKKKYNYKRNENTVEFAIHDRYGNNIDVASRLATSPFFRLVLTLDTIGHFNDGWIQMIQDNMVKKYIASKGFTFDEGLVENYYLSLKSKPFVILAGTSGTGKTRLVRLFAEAIGATSENGRYKLVPVRPDWSDSSDLFGHVSLNDKFIPGAIIDFVKQAELDSRNPYFLCLDEMNLARVEYYLSDILSIIETRNYDEDGKITTDPLITENYYGADAIARGKYGVVRIPENLYIIGTVNMDETTFPFSRKVLDRANTIEFSTVELLANFESTREEAKAILQITHL